MAGDRVRDEAERLIAAALAALVTGLRGGSFGSGFAARGGGFATGSAECCVCPVCRAIAAMRDPRSDFAERLFAGVGDLATGVTAILRAFSARGARPEPPEEPVTSEGDEFWEGLRRKAADAAKAYARASTGDRRASTVDEDPWRVATTQEAGADGEASTAAATTLVPRPTIAKKAVAKKAISKKAVAKKAVATGAGATKAAPTTGEPAAARTAAARAEPKKAVAKKAVAKKAVAKKAPTKRTPGKKAAPRPASPDGTA